MSPSPETRRFARFRRDAPPGSPDFQDLPEDGFCLSSYWVLHDSRGSGRILMGEPDPSAPWGHIGALSKERLDTGSGWMLPASHLLLFEGPVEAARRILAEQLDGASMPLPAPTIMSEAYRRPHGDSPDPHWDLQFIFEGVWPAGRPVPLKMWKRLEFVEVTRTPATQFRRGHGDILGFVGLSPRT